MFVREATTAKVLLAELLQPSAKIASSTYLSGRAPSRLVALSSLHHFELRPSRPEAKLSRAETKQENRPLRVAMATTGQGLNSSGGRTQAEELRR